MFVIIVYDNDIAAFERILMSISGSKFGILEIDSWKSGTPDPFRRITQVGMGSKFKNGLSFGFGGFRVKLDFDCFWMSQLVFRDIAWNQIFNRFWI